MSDRTAAARSILAQALELGVERIAEDASMATLEAWDSLAHIRLLSAIEARLGRQLSPEEAVGIAGVADIATLIDG